MRTIDDTRVVYRAHAPKLWAALVRTETPYGPYRGYTRTHWDLYSRTRPGRAQLDALFGPSGLVGAGQSYATDAPTPHEVPTWPVVLDGDGREVAGAVPRGWRGEPLTAASVLHYLRTRVRVICDSGD
jgi:hypothetical protein